MRSKQYVVRLVLTAFVGIVVSVAAWCFLSSSTRSSRSSSPTSRTPSAIRRSPGVVAASDLAIAGLIVALTIVRLPGEGGHIPARGLAAGGAPRPADLPGILLAGIARRPRDFGLGLVFGRRPR